MENIYYLLFFCLICWYFFYLRRVSEIGSMSIQKYCKQTGIQFIAVARRSSRLRFDKKKGVVLYSVFDFEFSGDGESNNKGTFTMLGLKLENVNLSAYRI